MNDTQMKKKLNDLLSIKKNLNDYYIINKKTYDDIYNLSGMIFNTLSETCTKDDYICIASEKKDIIAASIISSLAGGPGLILPYSYSKQVLEDVIKNEKISHIISDGPMEAEFHDKIKVLNFSDTPKGIDVSKQLKFSRNLDNDFIKLFTGGSTGAPKVWTKSVKNIFSEAFHLSKKFSVNKNDKFISTVPPYHIYGFLFSVILPLINGASVVEETTTFPREIASNIENNSASIFISVPMQYRVIKNIPIKKNNLRLAFSSAGALDEEDGSAFYQNTGIGVTEVYGSTETGGIATRNRSMGENSLTPFDCVSWDVKENRLSVKSEFISKELELNRQGFFLTGDRVEKTKKNSFNLLGRADGIIKVAGKRVDLGEVQNKIKSIDRVTDAIVFSLPTRSGRENEIVAMIESELNESKIKNILSKELEPYALPRRIRIEEKIPVLSTGKYDREKIKSFF